MKYFTNFKSNFFIFLVFFIVGTTAQTSAKESAGATRDNQEVTQLTEEDREIIRNMETLENLDWIMDADFDLLENLELFLTNS